MALTINSNISSLRTQRSLAENSKGLSTVFEQLSSGQRINRASDDAAGLAIADSLNAKSRVYSQGVRNLNDGISLVSIADGALSALTDITIRLKELAEQSANGVYSQKQREALDNEAQALSKEFTRVTKSTSFNGLNLFDGSVQGLRLQAGNGVDGSLSSTLGGALGTGTFQSATTASVGSRPSQVATGDFNGDGIVDVAVSNYMDDSISVLLGKGDGTFKSSPTLSVGNNGGGTTVATADFNGDGILDLVGSDLNGTFSVFLGKGDGTFKSVRSFTVGNGAYYFSTNIGDVNGDGVMDIIGDSYSGTVDVFLGKGDGTFGGRISSLTLFGSSRASAIGDLNNDGKIDIVLNDFTTNKVSVLLGNGNGTFTPIVSFTNSGISQSIGLGDLNGDGILDLVSSGYSNNNVSVYLGKGDGKFGTQSVLYSDNVVKSTLIGDLNGDGILDIVTSGYGDIMTFLGKGDGTFQNAFSFAAPYGTNTSSALADMNGDGVLDIVSGDLNVDFVDVFMGKTRDGVGSILNFSLKTKAGALQSMATFDNKLRSLSTQRGILGAFESRLNTAINTTQSAVENFKAAESRIRDIDVASASSELTRREILQQSAASVLGQANLQPQLALKLLQ